MSKGVNKVFLLGRLGQAPNVRRAQGNSKCIATVSIATNRSTKNNETGNYDEITDWHRVVFFDRLAETVEKYLNKGSQIFIEGRLQTRSWTDQSGTTKYITEVIANEMQITGTREPNASNIPTQPKANTWAKKRPKATKYSPPIPPNLPVTNLPDDQGLNDDVPF